MTSLPSRTAVSLGLSALLLASVSAGQAASPASPGSLALPSVQAQFQNPAVPAQPARQSPAQQIFDEVNDLIQSRYGGLSTVDRAALAREYQVRLDAVCAPTPATCPETKAYPVLEAELTALGDEHSFFQLPEEFQDFVASATGGNRRQFGVKLARLDGENRVVLEVVPQSAAEVAGLQRGDLIQTLNDQPYRYTELQAARREGRAIKLGVDRLGLRINLSLQAGESSTRDLPRLSYVGPLNDVALLRIPTFLSDGGIAQRVHDLVGEAKRRGARGVIVDLRGNTGGSLRECDSAVSAFVPTFTRIAREAGGDRQTVVRRGQWIENGRTRGGVRDPQLWTGPITVLVNEVSASCSEFFAYEVQYAKRGPIIGEETAGVGNTATRVFEVGENAALQLTITNYAKPGGALYPLRVIPDQVRAETEEEIRGLTRGEDVLLRAGLAALDTAPTIAADRP
ncbi:carboxyl-terminal processing protease [Deinococcus reticulitermitis]|uniref:Carboxyl-terminal processing protease n=1 Tax=Deinococcus reticulitermitis TaxID=856736 RepID=A0A1H6V575_9DEIO|nr:S41 family peptidase [Deinococcus reticulitermitis]SEI99713.1 carboxyl-terminal processing protease [Deinococcus reticulitermitis]